MNGHLIGMISYIFETICSIKQFVCYSKKRQMCQNAAADAFLIDKQIMIPKQFEDYG